MEYFIYFLVFFFSYFIVSKTLKKRDIRIEKIYTFPVKGCRGIEHKTIKLVNGGLEYDREWVLLRNKNGTFEPVTARINPNVLKITPSVKNNKLSLQLPSGEIHHINPPKTQAKIEFVLWRTKTHGYDQGDDIAVFLTSFLCEKYPIRLVRMYEASRKLNDCSKYGKFAEPHYVSKFSDWSPVTLLSLESLRQLNTQLKTPILHTNFRSNIIINGQLDAFEENTWKHFCINNINFNVAKPCIRCQMVTFCSETAQRDKTLEPLKTIKKKYNGIFSIDLLPQTFIQTNDMFLSIGDILCDFKIKKS